MESLAKTYVNTHGLRLKCAFAEILISLLHPIGKVSIEIPGVCAGPDAL